MEQLHNIDSQTNKLSRELLTSTHKLEQKTDQVLALEQLLVDERDKVAVSVSPRPYLVILRVI